PAASDMFFGMLSRFRTSQVASIRWLVAVEHFLAGRRKWRNVVAEAAIAAIAACTAAAVSTRTSVPGPEPGEGVLIIRLVGIPRVGCIDSTLSLSQKSGRQRKAGANEYGGLHPLCRLRLHGRTAPAAGAGAPPRGASPGPPPATPMIASPFSLSS